jgi:hypothetical protein
LILTLNREAERDGGPEGTGGALSLLQLREAGYGPSRHSQFSPCPQLIEPDMTASKAARLLALENTIDNYGWAGRVRRSRRQFHANPSLSRALSLRHSFSE